MCNGNFLGIGADGGCTAVEVEDCANYGLLITNGEFVAFRGPDPTMVDVKPTNRGSVRLVNCAFWGPCQQIARIAGRGYGRAERLYPLPMGRPGTRSLGHFRGGRNLDGPWL